jgi:multiple sugar transport system ATP-binding protein
MGWINVASVEFVEATHTYPGTRMPAVDNLNLMVESGEFMVLLGASGSGKTTALRMLAGLETVDSGSVYIDGRDVSDLEPGERDIAMVFQSYALYPQMTVAQNLGFRMTIMGTPHSAVARRVRRMASQLDLTPTLDRLPRTLSGGEQQRVAMGRAMMREPQVYLMDEPLGALDAKLRAQVRSQISTLQRRLGTTMLYVTHDQIEAMTMGDRIAVLKDGVLLQCDAPRVLYENPSNAYVAGFVGSPPMNLLSARVEHTWALVGDVDVIELPLGRALVNELPVPEVTIGFRPDKVKLAPPGTGLFAHVEAVENLGYVSYAHCASGLGDHRKDIIVRCEPGRTPTPGTAVGIALDPAEIHYFEPVSGRRLHAIR